MFDAKEEKASFKLENESQPNVRHFGDRYICSIQSRNLRNPGIAQRKPGILTLARNPEIAPRFAQS